ncbi:MULTISPECIES: class I SAM-dependent methyltransferase [Henriciella]|jgi:2-polyprenyl-3-methyl-5-hydroxy-6-metoxy-1,4-benzoquinol methylase|uniref:Methyltransferase domain-containing protein n=1 Tax=Henriciella pelagia TaxID=1977912 RepID=A0ABQ1JH56_9PROT|nr:class I SAM-dependent methyltransferase [Henriciella pelagia]GGB66447.1 hypothetical protein GCM10011503_14030 [Henriciella pelagia]
MKTATAKDQRFWDKLAAKYASQPIADQESYEKKLEITRKYLTPDSDVFEFGCGTGSTAILHAPYVRHILATDLADNMLAIGRDKAREAGIENVTFECTGIEEFDARGRQFDVVLALNIIHLCRDPLAVMNKARSLLKPGGHFIQSTVCLKDAMPIAPFVIPVMQLIGKAPHVKFLKRDQLFDQIDEAGFHVVETFRPERKLSAEFIVATPAP